MLNEVTVLNIREYLAATETPGKAPEKALPGFFYGSAYASFPCPCGALRRVSSVILPIVQISAHRPPHDGDARQTAVRHAAQVELMPSHRLMVAVVLCDKPVCVGKRHRFYSQHRLRLHQLYGGLP